MYHHMLMLEMGSYREEASADKQEFLFIQPARYPVQDDACNTRAALQSKSWQTCGLHLDQSISSGLFDPISQTIALQYGSFASETARQSLVLYNNRIHRCLPEQGLALRVPGKQ